MQELDTQEYTHRNVCHGLLHARGRRKVGKGLLSGADVDDELAITLHKRVERVLLRWRSVWAALLTM